MVGCMKNQLWHVNFRIFGGKQLGDYGKIASSFSYIQKHFMTKCCRKCYQPSFFSLGSPYCVSVSGKVLAKCFQVILAATV